MFYHHSVALAQVKEIEEDEIFLESRKDVLLAHHYSHQLFLTQAEATHLAIWKEKDSIAMQKIC